MSFFEQEFTIIKCGDFEIEVPEKHALVEILKVQPYRDACVGIAAKHISMKYPKGNIVDIGANVGDTAAMIATNARNKLILVEPSHYYSEILAYNILQLPNDVEIKQVLISDGSQIQGNLYHWGGTAFFREEEEGAILAETQRLCQIADENTCFVKTDTDGYDFKILSDSLEWLAKVRPAVLLENEIHSSQHLAEANELYACLMEIGYEYFIVWDDPGFHLLSTSSLDVLKDLNRYLFKVWKCSERKSIYNYDILCLHQKDRDIYESIDAWCKTY